MAGRAAPTVNAGRVHVGGQADGRNDRTPEGWAIAALLRLCICIPIGFWSWVALSAGLGQTAGGGFHPWDLVEAVYWSVVLTVVFWVFLLPGTLGYVFLFPLLGHRACTRRWAIGSASLLLAGPLAFDLLVDRGVDTSFLALFACIAILFGSTVPLPLEAREAA
jgi:hypothetical protein